MDFRHPFDSDQRAAAAKLYRDYRKNLKELRAKYPPVTTCKSGPPHSPIRYVAGCGSYMEPIEDWINPPLSREIVQLLHARGWTTARIARAIRARHAYVDRIEASDQSFSPQQVRTLARSLKTDVYRLFFEAMEPAALKSKDRSMWVSLRRVLESSDAFEATLHAKPTRKRRRSVKAA